MSLRVLFKAMREQSALDGLPAVLSVAEAAKVLPLSQKTIRRKLRDGELPGLKSGATWLIPTHRLIAHLEGDDA